VESEIVIGEKSSTASAGQVDHLASLVKELEIGSGQVSQWPSALSAPNLRVTSFPFGVAASRTAEPAKRNLPLS